MATGVKNSEPYVMVSPLDEADVAIAWRHTFSNTDPSSVDVQYRVSLDGAATFPHAAAFLPVNTALPCDSSGGRHDACAAASADGDIFIGAFVGNPGRWLLVSQLPLGQTVIQSSDLVQAGPCETDLPVDKEFMAIGLWPGGMGHDGQELAYFGFDDANAAAQRSHSFARTTSSFTWPTSPADPGYPDTIHLSGGDASGRGLYPLVLRQGGLFPGRVVMGYAPQFGGPPVGVFEPARYTSSDDAGASWATEGIIDHFGTGPIPPQVFRVLHPIDAAHVAPYVPVPGGISVNSWPMMCLDPTNARRVWAVFVGRTSDETSNLDLFISRSDDDGASFPPATTYAISDGQLRLPYELDAESDEVMAAICVDSMGGVNIAFVRTVSPDDQSEAVATVRYARWASASALANGEAPFKQDLSVPFLAWTAGGNEYLTLSTVGCSVYAAYAADPGPTPASRNWNIYVHRIVIPCSVADVTADGIVNEDDVLAFGAAYPLGLPPADVNRDGVVDAQDCIAFVTDYACGGCPH